MPLNNIMNIVDIVHDDERMGIIYNFLPCTQETWCKYFDGVASRVKNKIPVDKK